MSPPEVYHPPHTLVPLPSTLVPFAFPRPTVYKGRAGWGSRGQRRRTLLLIRNEQAELEPRSPPRVGTFVDDRYVDTNQRCQTEG